MSFLGDQHILLRETILDFAERHHFSENKALFLLIQYDWDEEAINADLNKATEVLNASLPENEEEDNEDMDTELCLSCNEENPFITTDCKHSICFVCLSNSLQTAMSQMTLLLRCPQCGFYLNQKLFFGRLPVEMQEQYTGILVAHYKSKTHFLQKGFNLLARNKNLIAAAIVATTVVHQVISVNQMLQSWKEKHPKLVKFFGNIHKRIKLGQDPTEPNFWAKVAWSSRGDIAKSLASLFWSPKGDKAK